MDKTQKKAGLSAQEQQYRRMTEAPVKPLIIKLAIPTIITMLVTSIYNMADTYFVSTLGKSVSGAVGVVFSLMAIIQAIGFTLGMGAGSIVSRALGVKDGERASRFGSVSLFTSLVAGLLLTVFGLIFIDPLMNALGSTPTVLPHARAYAQYILYGAPFICAAFVLNNLLRAEGKARLSMIGIVSGAVLNIALDPLFILDSGLGLGISGAAIATIIGQFVSFVILLLLLLKKSVIKISLTRAVKGVSSLLEIVKTGAPSFFRQGFASIAAILLNNQASVYGDEALSAMSIVQKIFMLIFCVGLGIGQGYQPVAGYNYSARRWSRLRKAYIFTYIVGTVCMTVLGALAFILAPRLIPMFIDDADVFPIGIRALRFQAIAMPLLSINVMCNMTFQATGQKLKAVLLSCCRQGFFFIPAVLTLPVLFGLTGVEMVQSTADLLTFTVSIFFFVRFYRQIRRLEREEPTPLSVPEAADVCIEDSGE